MCWNFHSAGNRIALPHWSFPFMTSTRHKQPFCSAHVEMESVAALTDWFALTSGSALADGGLMAYTCTAVGLKCFLYCTAERPQHNIRKNKQIEKKNRKKCLPLVGKLIQAFQAFCLFKLHAELSWPPSLVFRVYSRMQCVHLCIGMLLSCLCCLRDALMREKRECTGFLRVTSFSYKAFVWVCIFCSCFPQTTIYKSRISQFQTVALRFVFGHNPTWFIPTKANFCDIAFRFMAKDKTDFLKDLTWVHVSNMRWGLGWAGAWNGN